MRTCKIVKNCTYNAGHNIYPIKRIVSLVCRDSWIGQWEILFISTWIHWIQPNECPISIQYCKRSLTTRKLTLQIKLVLFLLLYLLCEFIYLFKIIEFHQPLEINIDKIYVQFHIHRSIRVSLKGSLIRFLVSIAWYHNNYYTIFVTSARIHPTVIFL